MGRGRLKGWGGVGLKGGLKGLGGMGLKGGEGCA